MYGTSHQIVHGLPSQNKYRDGVDGLLQGTEHALVSFLAATVQKPEFLKVLSSINSDLDFKNTHFVVTDTGSLTLSPKVMSARRNEFNSRDKIRLVELPLSFFATVKERLTSKSGSTIKYGHIIGVFLHELLHPGKFRYHQEEYAADKAAILAMIRLGLDPQDYLDVFAVLLDIDFEASKKESFGISHPSLSTRITELQIIIDEERANDLVFDQRITNNPLNSPVSSEILASLEAVAEHLKEQRANIASSPEALQERLYDAQSLTEFAELYVVYEVKSALSQGMSAYHSESNENFHAVNLFMLSTAFQNFALEQEVITKNRVAQSAAHHYVDDENRVKNKGGVSINAADYTINSNGWKNINAIATSDQNVLTTEYSPEIHYYHEQFLLLRNIMISTGITERGYAGMYFANDLDERTATSLRNFYNTRWKRRLANLRGLAAIFKAISDDDEVYSKPSLEAPLQLFENDLASAVFSSLKPKELREICRFAYEYAELCIYLWLGRFQESAAAKELYAMFFRLKSEFVAQKYSREFPSKLNQFYISPLTNRRFIEQSNQNSEAADLKSGILSDRLIPSKEQLELKKLHQTVGVLFYTAGFQNNSTLAKFSSKLQHLIYSAPELQDLSLEIKYAIFDGLISGEWDRFEKLTANLPAANKAGSRHLLNALFLLANAVAERDSLLLDGSEAHLGYQQVLGLLTTEYHEGPGTLEYLLAKPYVSLLLRIVEQELREVEGEDAFQQSRQIKDIHKKERFLIDKMRGNVALKRRLSSMSIEFSRLHRHLYSIFTLLNEMGDFAGKDMEIFESRIKELASSSESEKDKSFDNDAYLIWRNFGRRTNDLSILSVEALHNLMVLGWLDAHNYFKSITERIERGEIIPDEAFVSSLAEAFAKSSDRAHYRYNERMEKLEEFCLMLRYDFWQFSRLLIDHKIFFPSDTGNQTLFQLFLNTHPDKLSNAITALQDADLLEKPDGAKNARFYFRLELIKKLKKRTLPTFGNLTKLIHFAALSESIGRVFIFTTIFELDHEENNELYEVLAGDYTYRQGEDVIDETAEFLYKIAAKFNNFGSEEDFRQCIQQVIDFECTPQVRFEMCCALWALAAHINPAQKSAFMRICKKQMPPKLDIYLGDLFKYNQQNTDAPYDKKKYISKARYNSEYAAELDEVLYFEASRFLQQEKGKKFFALEAWEREHQRRFPFETGMEFPFTNNNNLVIHSVFFTEYFLAHSLLEIDEDLKNLLSQNPLQAIKTAKKQMSGIKSTVIDIYTEHFIREALELDKISEDTVDNYIQQYHQMTETAKKATPELARSLLDIKMKLDKGFFDNAEYAIKCVSKLLPNPSSIRDEYLHLITINCSITPMTLLKLDKLLAKIERKQDKSFTDETETMIELIGQMYYQQKTDFICYLISPSQKEPTGASIDKLTGMLNCTVRDLRTVFYSLSDDIRTKIIRRMLFTPNGVLGHERSALDRQSVAERVAAAVSDVAEGANIAKYVDLLAIGLGAIRPKKAASLVAKLINLLAKKQRNAEKVTIEEMAYVASLAFGSVGIKAAQLIVDFPWVDPLLKAEFAKSMWSAEVLPAIRILEQWQAEKKARNFQGYEIVSFEGSAGSAGANQVYKAKVKFPDETVRVVALKAAKPQLVALRPIQDDGEDLKSFLQALENRGYKLDIPNALSEIVLDLLQEERQKGLSEQFQQDYRARHKANSTFIIPEIYASGEHLVLEEWIDGKVLDFDEINDMHRLLILQNAMQDLDSGLINVDVHGGNFFMTGAGQLALVDNTMNLDLRNNPEAHRAVKSLYEYIVKGNANGLVEAFEHFGLNSAAAREMDKATIESRIDLFRRAIATADNNKLVLHKVLWWLYRLQAHFNGLSPATKQFVASFV